MIGILQSSLSNIAIIFFMHFCITVLLNAKSHIQRFYFQLGMISFVSLAVILILYLPIKYDGYQFDLRLIPLVFLSIKWGWKYALPALVITSVWRLGMGGEGAVPGVLFGMALPVVFSLFYQRIVRLPGASFIFFLFSITWMISDLPIISFLPDGWNIFKEIFLVRYVSILLTALTLYIFIYHTEKELRLKHTLQLYAERDSLTGLYNIRFFMEKIKDCANHVKKKKFIIMIDIDHFKDINDTHGHLNGDHILKNVAACISNTVDKHRNNSHVTIGRYGGEEFILFLSVEELEDAKKIASSIRKEIEDTDFYTENTMEKVNLTVSLGVSELADWSKLKHTIEQADNCLFTSKRNGRNQINYAFPLEDCQC